MRRYLNPRTDPVHLHPPGQLPCPGHRSRRLPCRSHQTPTARRHPGSSRRANPRPHRRRTPSQIGRRRSRLNGRAPPAPCGPPRGDEFRTLTENALTVLSVSQGRMANAVDEIRIGNRFVDVISPSSTFEYDQWAAQYPGVGLLY
jgi:hypothetical protein